MKIKELREKNIEELQKMILEKQEKIRKFRFDIATKQVKNTREIRSEKKDIARILTLINEKNKENGK
ncbi:MAG: 50S ribosomal protein L29 [Candidatus Moranbacteria bacterium RIFOXYA12_FULL_35_19]|jgi:large subunit ribosomal protein L29|nr:MAG: 50S ribosomal protein L29 [Candidatus Moranbacteria bacterium GW2011_GWF2_35_39]OGI31654.1 MAG: 50S ribosomal protein L29 [Candidatus Moranbacteria bacterium RIFOXYB12_FULL_35_8]OGI32814.1 MAG: 50S ribosomal protein L29 [Candidatus Moranbacteria bacterium RIFOXYC12_FULL_36_13]OGI36142.1 MAG: 50S ribosomal protein L29 [Candidatus Moranbacteria bacterium RIFOXYA12_FULL_35_19]